MISEKITEYPLEINPVEAAYAILGEFDLDLDDHILGERVSKAVSLIKGLKGRSIEASQVVASAFYAWMNEIDVSMFAPYSRGGGLLIGFVQGIVASDTSVTFPIEWNFGDRPSDGLTGPAVNDPLTIYVTSTAYGELPAKFSIKDIIDELLLCSGDDNPDILEKLRDAFIGLADDIDAVLKGGENEC